MKKMVLFVLGVSVCAVLGWYANRPQAHAVPVEPVADTVAAPSDPEPVEAVMRPSELSVQTVSAQATIKPVARLVASATKAAVEATFLSGTVDLLVSPQATYEQKQAAWKQLKETGKLDQAITELERRTADDPRTAEYPATLGKAYLQKCATIQDVREQGILAMQADKVFDTALNLDPNNWDARFTKAVALSYWPPMMNKGDEVIQHFQTLIQQQEAQAPQPQYAQTYLWLGEQYQKAGREDDARGVWQRGAALFPNYEQLQGKLAGTP